MTRKLSVAGLTIIMVTFVAGYAESLCVNAEQANVRTGPGTGYKIAWEVYRYMPFAKVGVSLSGSWYAVKDVDGDVSWIHKGLVTDRFDCAVVKKERVNMRTGPGAHHAASPAGPAEQYQSFKVLQRKGQWIKVKDDMGNAGWIYRAYLWIQ